MNNSEWLSREEALIGSESVEKLRASRVLLFGVGGVGGAAFEALVRAGIGHITVVDGDKVSESNINRQVIATTLTLRMPKVEAAKMRGLLINPDVYIRMYEGYAGENNLEEIFELAKPDFVIDAIDQTDAKLLIAKYCTEHGIGIISSMGTGNKLDPTKFEIADISKTSVCPLARVMRRELSRMGINHLTVLYSREEPVHTGQRTPASISYVPTAAGLIIAGYCLRKLGDF